LDAVNGGDPNHYSSVNPNGHSGSEKFKTWLGRLAVRIFLPEKLC